MKNNQYTILCILFFSIFQLMHTLRVVAQWTVIHNDNTCNFYGIYFTDSLTGYVAGSQNDSSGIKSVIKKTTNGGNSWEIMALPPCANNTLMSITFTDSVHGIAVGGNGLALTTFDGGNNWTCQNSGTLNDLLSVHFPNDFIGYAVGRYRTIVKTIDGGISWYVINEDTMNYMISDVFFINADTGFVTSGAGVRKTIDGGSSWSNFLTQQQYPSSVFFINKDTGYVCGDYYLDIARTEDGGFNWSILLQNYTAYIGLSSILFVNDSVGYATGGHIPPPMLGENAILLKTSDAGITWVQDTTIYSILSYYSQCYPNSLSSLFFINNDTGFLTATYCGIILKTITGGGMTNRNVIESNNVMIIPNPVENKMEIKLNHITPGLTYKLIITDIQGKIIYLKEFNNSNVIVDVTFFKNGIYFVRLFNHKEIINTKFIKI